MQIYAQGLVSISPGSQVITGTDTFFVTMGLIEPGSLLTFDDRAFLRITEVISDTELRAVQLITEDNYSGQALVDAPYKIIKSYARQTNSGLADDFVQAKAALLAKEFEFTNWLTSVDQTITVTDVAGNEHTIPTVRGFKELYGQNGFTWPFVYADDINGNGLSTSPAGKRFIGIANGKDTPTPTMDAADYEFSRFVGLDGVSPDAPDAPVAKNVTARRVPGGIEITDSDGTKVIITDGADAPLPTFTQNPDGSINVNDGQGNSFVLAKGEDGYTPQYGIDYRDGKDGSYHSFVFKTAVNQPADPTGGSYDGVDEVLPSGTRDTPYYEDGKITWVASRKYRHDGANWVGGAWSSYSEYIIKGVTGRRGLDHQYVAVTGNSWSNALAHGAYPNGVLNGDQVTQFNNTDYVETRYWDGSIWNDTKRKVIDGTLIVNGDAIIPQIFANDITVSQSVTATNDDKTVRMSATGDYAFLARRGNNTVFAVGGDNDVIDGLALKPGTVTGAALSQDALDLITEVTGLSAANTGGLSEGRFNFSDSVTGTRATIRGFLHGTNPLTVRVSCEGSWTVNTIQETYASATCYIEVSPAGANSWSTLKTFNAIPSTNSYTDTSGDTYTERYNVTVTANASVALPSTYAEGEYDFRFRVASVSSIQSVGGSFSVKEKATGAVGGVPDNISVNSVGIQNVGLSHYANQLQIDTPYGYVRIGPQNSSWMHMISDRSFYFNQTIQVNGQIRAYNSSTYMDNGGLTSDGTIRTTGDMQSDLFQARSGNAVVLSAGEFGSHIKANASGEVAYVAGESGVKALSSTNNAGASGGDAWGGRNEITVIDGEGYTYLNRLLIDAPNSGQSQVIARFKHNWANANLALCSENSRYGSFRLESNHSDREFRIQTCEADGGYYSSNGDVGTIAAFRRNGDLWVNNKVYCETWKLHSDPRLKKNREEITDALNKVGQLTGYAYDHVKGYRSAGIMADVLQQVLPDAVEKDKDGLLCIEPSGVIALVVNAINALNAKVDKALING